MEAWGAQGASENATNRGGYGGYVKGEIYIGRKTELAIYVGQQPNNNNLSTPGWNGGGGSGYEYYIGNMKYYFGPGGGGTDIRIVSGNWDDEKSLISRFIVAAGGGGAGRDDNVGYGISIGSNGGGLNGYDGNVRTQRPSTIYAKGATQTAGGANSSNTVKYSKASGFGYGGTGETGGGGGWYGGGGNTNCNPGAAGGSSYISGHTGSVGVTSTSDSSPKSGCTTGTTNTACSLTPYINPATGTYYTFTNTKMIDGAGYSWTNVKGGLEQMPNPNGGYYASGVGHSGNGAARITYLGTAI